MFGVADVSVLSQDGLPWMIGTKRLDKYPMTVLRHCRDHVKEMGKGYAAMFNYVYAGNIKAIKWLTWMGFKFGSPQPMGLFCQPFIRFEMVLT
jgi:hypothetical protein